MSYPAGVLFLDRERRRWASLAAAMAMVGALHAGAPAAVAQPSDADKAAALKAFEEGLDLEKKGDYDAALARFQKVGSFKMTPHVRFHIALCEEKLGRIAAAIRGFELAEAEAIKMGKDAQVVAEKAPVRAEALRKRVAAVRVDVKGRVLYSRVLLDGEPLAEKDFGSLVNVDPGAHTISVETDGVVTQKREVTLPEKGYETITLEIVDKERPAPTATATATATTTAPPPPPPPPPPPSKVPALVLGGVGALSLIGAGVFYGLRVGALDAFNQVCNAGTGAVKDGVLHCEDRSEVTGPYSDAQTFTVAAGVMLGVGAAALGGAGVYWFVTQRPPKGGKDAPAVGLRVGPAALGIVGKF